MASLRTGSGLPARPSDGYRPRKSEDGTPRASIPRPVNRSISKDTEVPRSMRHLPPSHTSARAPQLPGTRGSILPRPSLRNASDPQGKPSSTGSRTSSETSKSHYQTGSGSSSSSRSFDNTSKASHALNSRMRPSMPRDSGSSHKDSGSTSSSNSTRRYQDPSDPGLGIQYDRQMTESPAEIRVGEAVELRKALAQPPVIYPELDRYRDFQRPEYSLGRHEIDVPYRLATHDLPPPTPGSLLFSGSSSQISAVSGSPSTKFSESPGPGPYSRDTTPTSISSQSPVFVAPSRVGVSYRNVRQQSATTTRPPVTRRRAGSFPNVHETETVDPHGLASVRESLTSSSSNSTVKDGDRAAKKEKTKGRQLPPPPPSPPPRKSSQKFRKTKEAGESIKAASPQHVRQKDNSLKQSPQSPPSGSASPPKTGPPARPSRHNTPDMKSQLFTNTPIIQSNLISTIRANDGRGNGSLTSISLPGSVTSLSQTRQNVSTSNLPSYGREETVASPKPRSSIEKKDSSLKEPTPSIPTLQPSVRSASRSRFPFFGRKKNGSDSSTKSDEKTERKKLNRKGPVAGTGHEGYGRVGSVRRRSGSGSALPRSVTDPLASYDSLTSSDSFLADRMNPVIISGGEIIENRNASSELPRPDVGQSTSARPSTDSKVSLDGSSTSRNNSTSPLGASTLPRGQTSASRRPSDSSGSDDVNMRSTIAFRRSVQRLRSSPDSPLRLPQPIKTSGHVSSSPMTSFDTSILSDESHIELQLELSRESGSLQPPPKKLQKKSRSPRRWNLFSRSQGQPDSKKSKANEQVAATVKAVEKRPVAFYAMMDTAEQEEAGPTDIQAVLRDADVYTHSPSLIGSADILPVAQPTDILLGLELANQRSWKPPSDSVSVTTIASSSAAGSSHSIVNELQTSGRPSRLAQVGRIPHVVKKRPENPSPQSFSRPFRASLQPPARNANEVYDPDSIATGPTPPKSTTPVPELSGEGSTLESGNNPSSCADSSSNMSPVFGRAEKEFLSFSPRKNSTGTMYTSSSSSGGANPFATATAVIPKPDDPPAEDEIWDEYNDLLGEESMRGPQSATSSKGIPFHLETYQNKLAKEKGLESPTLAIDSRKASTYSKAPTHSTSYSADMTERIRTAFQPKPSPTTMVTSIPRIDEGGESESPMNFEADIKSRRASSSSCRTASDRSSCSSNDGSPLAQVNLRVGSMTVSKWLTFGHVLFSEVRHELAPVKNSLNHHSILVIDGLGNDDWSFYAAETYPAASFFNLSPRAPLPAELRNSPTGFPLSPPNHHQIQYNSHSEKFPFAPQSFDAVVYRFPIVAPESHYRNILSEARRVLRPDGYIELSILDSDLNNMGNRGRRTIRRLKEQIRLQRPDTSFASTADLIVRLLGKVGFSDIKAARVGVPVASSITRPGSRGVKNKEKSDKKKDPPSLAEMMSDNSPMADENITKIVTRVGRWWYTRCYESVAGVTQKDSIWNDRTLLSECEQFGTSLKLMVCCARAPDRITSF
ncbi:hypothetical protein QQS21_004013 [Conoideocrella luteorostrata]|uniref:Methyltransferase type 11 domain-containing protein n=1 Tax=Conoideocrella luteorostrata TaxID=1105319 RepID=A0AAJ0CUQ7_9HYPO|nr:hypothetical protein QQS21_004013 [Conoideocrella luteorostrata]